MYKSYHAYLLLFYYKGVVYSGVAQLPMTLQQGRTYYTTVRGVTNDGHVLESISDGFLVDLTPGMVAFDRLDLICISFTQTHAHMHAYLSDFGTNEIDE